MWTPRGKEVRLSARPKLFGTSLTMQNRAEAAARPAMGPKMALPPLALTHAPGRENQGPRPRARGPWRLVGAQRPAAPGARPVARVPGSGASWCRRPWPAAGCLCPHTNTARRCELRRPGQLRQLLPGRDQAGPNNCTRQRITAAAVISYSRITAAGIFTTRRNKYPTTRHQAQRYRGQ